MKDCLQFAVWRRRLGDKDLDAHDLETAPEIVTKMSKAISQYTIGGQDEMKTRPKQLLSTFKGSRYDLDHEVIDCTDPRQVMTSDDQKVMMPSRMSDVGHDLSQSLAELQKAVEYTGDLSLIHI